MKYLASVLFIAAYFLFLSGCEDNSSNNSQNNQSSITYKDIPCNSEGLFKTSSFNNVELSWVLNNNILNIDLNHLVTCGSLFKDSITYHDKNFSVNLTDTSSVHYHCSCEHGTKVSVNVGTDDEVRLLFSIKSFSHNDYQVMLDKLLNIR